jgi:hypothetical protein
LEPKKLKQGLYLIRIEAHIEKIHYAGMGALPDYAELKYGSRAINTSFEVRLFVWDEIKNAIAKSDDNPTFDEELVEKNKVLGAAWSFALPPYSDPLQQPVTVKVSYMPSTASSFIKYDDKEKKFTIKKDAATESLG